MKERDIPPAARQFEQKVLEFMKSKCRGPIRIEVVHSSKSRRKDYSGKDLAAGAEAEDRRDEVAEEMRKAERERKKKEEEKKQGQQ